MPSNFFSLKKSDLNEYIFSKIMLIPLFLLLGSVLLWTLVCFRPILNSSEDMAVSFPTNLDEVKKLFRVLILYKENHWTYVLLLFSSGYIYKQTFAIPGSALLNILAGAVFGCWPYGVLLCSFLTACGASNCFLLSKHAGKDLIKRKFPAQIAWLQEKLVENEGQLFFFLVSLRLFPATPNWLINIVAPIVNIPLSLFFLSVLIGLFPYNFLCMKAGETLAEIKSVDEIFTPKRLLFLLGSALVVFGLSRISNKQKVKFK